MSIFSDAPLPIEHLLLHRRKKGETLMPKIALNLQDLSSKAIAAYMEKIGKKAYFFQRVFWDEKGIEDHYNDWYIPTTPELADEERGITTVFDTPELEYVENDRGENRYPRIVKKLAKGFYDKHSVYMGDHDRLDPVLISAIEELGEEAGASVVDVPDDVKWHIEFGEESGIEWVAEDHRKWF